MSNRAAKPRGRETCLGLLVACSGHATSAPRPPPCPSAPIVATSQESLDALAACPTLPGLTIRSAARLDLSPLAGLTTVHGDLIIGPTLALDRVSLPALAEVGGRLAIVSGTSLGGIFLPALTHAGALEVRDDISLAELMTPRLATIAGALTIIRVPSLELVDATALTTVGDLTIAAPHLVTWLGTAPAAAGTRTVDAPALAGP